MIFSDLSKFPLSRFESDIGVDTEVDDLANDKYISIYLQC